MSLTPPPLAPTAPAITGLGVPVLAHLLPQTGMGAHQAAGPAGIALVLLGAALILRSRGPAWGRWLLPVLVAAGIGTFAVRAVLLGAIGNGWDAVALAVAVFTLSFAALAAGELLPAPVSRASRPAGRRVRVRTHRHVSS